MVPYCYLFLLSVFMLWFAYYMSDIIRQLNDHLSGKELFIRFTACALVIEGRIWDLILSVPDHCLSFTLC